MKPLKHHINQIRNFKTITNNFKHEKKTVKCNKTFCFKILHLLKKVIVQFAVLVNIRVTDNSCH